MEIDNKNSQLFSNLPLVIAGPCSAESLEQMLMVANEVKKNPLIKVFRAGIWKPRTRPNQFEGLGEIALPWLLEVKKATGLLTAVEVANLDHVEKALKYDVDILWIGARTTANPFSVQDIANALKGTNKTIMVKNPINADLQLWIGALERLNLSGVKNLIAVHRGFSVAENFEFRNDPMWRIPIELKLKFPELPIICDPSHITGNRELIFKVAQKAMDLNFDGLMIETHPKPEAAWSDANQQVTPQKLLSILSQLQFKQDSCQSKDFEFNLESIRKQIDRLDQDIIETLKYRKSLVENIAKIKLEQNVSALQLHRFESLLKDRIELAVKNGLDPVMVKDIFGLIHEESIRIQTDHFDQKH